MPLSFHSNDTILCTLSIEFYECMCYNTNIYIGWFILMKNKLICVLLAALLTMASCGTQNDTPETNNSSETADTTETNVEKNIYEELGEMDLNGRTYMILDSNQYPSIHINIPADTLTGDTVNDALYQRGIDVSEKFGVDIQYIQTPDVSEGAGMLRNSVWAGDQDYQLIIAQISGGTALGTLATDGVLANLCDISDLSLDQKWWSSLMYKSLKYNDTMYYTSGDISPSMYQMPACIYLNKKLLNDYGITTDYYQMVRDGKWTIDELTALAKDRDIDVNADNIMHTNDDFFGFVHQTNATTMMVMLVGCGLKLSENTADGIEIHLDTEYAYNVYDKISALKRAVKFDTQYDTINKAFFTDRAIAMQHFVASTSMLRDMESDYMVLPMAKYDEMQENYYSLCNPWCDAFIGVPLNADYEFVGTITEALARYSYIYIRPEALETNLQHKYLRDEESIEMLNIIYDSTYLDYNACYEFGGLNSAIANALVNDKPIASTIASNQSKAEVAIETFLETAFNK